MFLTDIRGPYKENTIVNKSWRFALLGLLVLIAAVLFVNLAPVHSAPQGMHTEGRFCVFTYPSGMTGFFDADEGVVYVYDPNLTQCVMVRKITRLGDAMKKLK
jgi:hypothetical protein